MENIIHTFTKKLRKVGNSFVVTIPKPLVNKLKLENKNNIKFIIDHK